MRKSVDAFTSLRGLSCLFVILCHDDSEQGRNNKSILGAGIMCVDFFFVLSAYLLTKNFMGDIQPDANYPPKRVVNMTLVKYFVRRFFRVYPPYVATVFLNYAIYAKYKAQMPYGTQWFDHVKGTLIFDRVFNHLWTIRVEIYFYFIVLPLYGLLATEFLLLDARYFSRTWFKSYGLFICLPIFFVGIPDPDYVYGDDPWIAWKLIEPFYPTFYFGMLGGITSHFLQTWVPQIDTRFKSIVVEVATYLIMFRICCGNAGFAKRYFGDRDHFWLTHRYTIAPFYSLLLFLLEKTENKSSFSRFLSAPFLIHMGLWSYSVYLVHWGIMAWVRINFDVSNIDGTILIVFFAYLVGSFMYKLVEEPFSHLHRYVNQFLETSSQYLKKIASSILNRMRRYRQFPEEGV